MASTIADRRVSETRFRAMGSDFHVIAVDGSSDACAAAQVGIEQLEARWSRFRPDSEVCRLNAAAGRPVLLSADTFEAVSTAIRAWRDTDGRFDPTILPALAGLGYDRDFATLAHQADQPQATPAAAPAPGCAGIEFDEVVGAITLPAGTAIDLGGIGKGLAADLVAAELLEAGAAGACVNAGGDVRVTGAGPTDDGWVVDVEHLPDVRLALAEGAVATSSSLKRQWVRGGATYHHLLDPRHGLPAASGLTACTVVAGSAAAAEVLTKAVFVAGPEAARGILGAAHAAGLLVTDAGTVVRCGDIEEYER